MGRKAQVRHARQARRLHHRDHRLVRRLGIGVDHDQRRRVVLRGSAQQRRQRLRIGHRHHRLVDREAPVGRDRVAAAKLLLSMHPTCDVLVSDDGLQHRRLARDFEIAVIHGRGLGNGWLLPAGPLREPPRRLRDVDAVVFNGRVHPVRIYSPFFFLRTEVSDTYCLAKPERRGSLDVLVRRQAQANLRLMAACGIGTPESFFQMLRDRGLRFKTLALPDHYAYRRNPFPRHGVDGILITEKDAVKCRADRTLAHDERLWVVPLRAFVDQRLTELIETRLRGAQNGSEAA